MKMKSLFTLLIALTVVFGCNDDNDNTGGETGKLKVQLTDAPFPHDLVTEANVTIFKMDARHTEDGTSEDEKEESSFVVLMEEEVQVNLLELTNGVTETLLNTEVPAGSYDLIRVYVKGVNIVLEDGTTYDLKVPSGEQSGIKIFIKPGLVVQGGLTSDVLLDFDVSKSFVPKGSLNAITGFNFKPVIKACNLSTAGTLTGLVTEIKDEIAIGVEGVQIGVFAADTLNTTTFTTEGGEYMVKGLQAGTYSLKIEKEGYEMQAADNIEISAGNKTVRDFEILAIGGLN